MIDVSFKPDILRERYVYKILIKTLIKKDFISAFARSKWANQTRFYKPESGLHL